ncbi:hypothetical protein B566_EDAN001513 [Ephemera danica]|nr:hypothetical protein B566_EDAN001513 [Ephemera danica]
MDSLRIDIPGDAYLVKRERRLDGAPSCAVAELEDEQLELVHREEDDTASSVNPEAELIAEYHVLYSLSYSVPVLYFNVWRNNGTLLTLEELWGRVAEPYKQAVNLAKWNTLTQKEHPVLGTPFFQLHPCHTAELLCQVPNRSGNPLLTWLSSVSCAVGLRIPHEYALPRVTP